MKITTIQTYVVRTTLGDQAFGWSQRVGNSRQTAICVVTTDEGFHGVGEAFYFGGPATIAAQIIEEALGPLILEQDPLDNAVLWDRLYNWTRDQGQKGVTISALSAIDIALWDIAGKAFDLPVSTLLGGRVRDTVAVYATGLYYTAGEFPDRLLDEARGYVDMGFKGMKTKVGGLTLDEDARRVAAIREAIGPDIFLAVDANCGYNPAAAIRMARRLADLDIHWFEEPISAKDVDGYLKIQDAAPMPLAAGECWRTRFEARDFLAKGAVDIAQPDVTNVGGIAEARNVAVMANAFGIKTNLHVWGSPVMIAASLHVSATLPSCPRARAPQPFVQEPVMEFDRTPSASRETLSRIPFAQADGYVAVPQGPGLGVDIDETVVERLCVAHRRTAAE